MGNRRVVRTKMVLPVRVSGVDSTGKAFNYLAHTLDITLKGARLGGVRSLLNLGDAVEVQCRHRKARFRVAWLGRPGHASEHQIGVEALEPEKPIWGLDLVDREQPDEFVTRTVPHAGTERQERRGPPRYPVTAVVELRYADDQPTMWADVTDISSDGCYAASETPLRVGTELTLTLRIEACEIDAVAIVRTCHPKVGMGIELIEFRTPEDADLFAKVVEQVSTAPNSKAATTTVKPDATAVSRRLQLASRELDDIGELLKSVEVDPLVLREFRGALSHVRTTAWAVQRWIEIHDRRDDPFPVLNYINVERLHLATKVCRNLCNDMQSIDPHLPKDELQQLLHTVEDLFAHLSIVDFTNGGIVEEAPPVPPAPKASRAAAGGGHRKRAETGR